MKTKVERDDNDTPAKPMKRCPQHPKAAVMAANMQETHGVCSKCGFEPLEWTSGQG